MTTVNIYIYIHTYIIMYIYIYIYIIMYIDGIHGVYIIHQLLPGRPNIEDIHTKNHMQNFVLGNSVRTAHGRHQEVPIVFGDARSLVPRSFPQSVAA